MLRLILFALLIAMPIAEIAVFLVVGQAIGVLPTILLIVATAVAGAVLLRQQGLAALMALQRDAREHRVPAASIADALAIGIAGVLLLTPGFITDTMGLVLFIPGVRRAMFRSIANSIRVERVGPQPGPGRTGPRVIELDAADYRPADDGSPWRDDRFGNDRR